MKNWLIMKMKGAAAIGTSAMALPSVRKATSSLAAETAR